MLKNKKIILLIVLVLGVLLIGGGIFLGFGKERKSTELKKFKISGKYLVRVNDKLISSDGSNYTYYDLNGKKIIELESDNGIFDSNVLELMNTKDDLFVFTKDGLLYGVVDSSKNEILQNKYSSVKIVSKNCFIVMMEDDALYRVVNANGDDLLGISYDYARVYDGAGAILKNGEEWTIIDENGKKLSNKNYSYAFDYKYDRKTTTILVGQYSDNTSDIYIFKNGSVNIIEKTINSIFLDDEYVYYGVSDGTFSAYNLKDGKIKKNVEVDFSINGMITTISEDGLLGFKSTDGKNVIKEQYQVDGTSSFTEYGVAVVSINNLKGIIDKTGKQIIPCKYKSIYVISDKVFVVSEDDNQTYYLIGDNDKKIYDKALYDGVSNFVIVYQADKCGIIDRNGKNVTGLDNLNCKVYNDTYLVNEKENTWLIGRS